MYSHFHLILHDTSTMYYLEPDQCKSVDHLFTLIHKLISVCNVTCSVTNVAAAEQREQRPHLTKHHLITTLQHPAAVHYTAFGPLKNNNNNRAADHRLHDSAQSAGCRNSGKKGVKHVGDIHAIPLFVSLNQYIYPWLLFICHTYLNSIYE